MIPPNLNQLPKSPKYTHTWTSPRCPTGASKPTSQCWVHCCSLQTYSSHKLPILMSYLATHQAVRAGGFCCLMSYLELALLILVLKYLTSILSISLSVQHWIINWLMNSTTIYCILLCAAGGKQYQTRQTRELSWTQILNRGKSSGNKKAHTLIK